jgi:hypothetical protein
MNAVVGSLQPGIGPEDNARKRARQKRKTVVAGIVSLLLAPVAARRGGKSWHDAGLVRNFEQTFSSLTLED